MNELECPFCKSRIGGKVLDVRVNSDGQPRRRRECHACKGRWTTIELRLDQLVQLQEKGRVVLRKKQTPRGF